MSDEMNRNSDENDVTTNSNKTSEQSQYSFWAEQVASSESNSKVDHDNINQAENTSNSDPSDSNLKDTDSANGSREMNQDVKNESNANWMGSNPTTGDSNNNQSYGQPNINGNQQYSQMNQENPYYYQFGNNGSFQQVPPNNRKPRNLGSNKFARMIGGAVAAGLIAGGCFVGVVAAYQNITGANSSYTLSIGSNADSIAYTAVLEEAVVPDTDVTEVYKNTLPSIVAIDSTISESITWFGQTYEQEETGSGSGIIVGQTDTELLIATNNHVVDGATKIEVTYIDGTKVEGITKGTDATADLAVVAVDINDLSEDTLNQIKVASLGNSDEVMEGEMAIAIGNALGYGQSITVGYVSAVNRTVELDTGTMELIQTDAAINPGNSGGALINANGEVIGINSAKLAADSIEGIGYAIPISYAYPILEELMSREIIKESEQGYLGVYIQDVTEEISEAYNLPVGVLVRGFSEGSGAEEAGIQERDIITGIDGVEVTTSTALKEKVISYRYGTTITVTVQRSVDGVYQEMEFEVTLGQNPSYTEDSSQSDTESDEQADEPSDEQTDEQSQQNAIPDTNSGRP